ncbi:OLC1v1009406C1 [Oldenlandia corymbosa var. corymbosa]|nr:OLC1v1009406C1 [Oldenlandia corymbosa var. corymbosa]
MKLSEFVRCPIKVQRCAGRTVQTELVVQVDQCDVVPGDIIVFEPGDLFPGDVRLLTSKNLLVSQSSLTGEFGSTEKTADVREDASTPLLDLRNICFMGTSVVSGVGTGLVVSTGSKTYMSTIFSTTGKLQQPDDFERGIRHVSYVLIALILVVVTIIVLINYHASHDSSESIVFGISVASALTPQMLPLIINASLAKGALAMASKRCIVKSLSAIRDMGSMDIICIDKTGTLTKNTAIMIDYLDCWGTPKEKLLNYAFLHAYFKTQQKHPLDDAIMAYAYANNFRFQPSKWSKIDEIPFDFTRRRVSVILEPKILDISWNTYFRGRVLITKGALEEVVKLCSFVEDDDGTNLSTFTVQDNERILNISEKLSSNGLRLLGVAIKRLETVNIPGMVYDEQIESNMIFLGLLSFFDPPKDSAKQALWQLAERGVKAKVLAGDTLSLAISICKEVGIRTTHVATGPELEILDTGTFHETVKRATVLAKLTPTQKLRVVQSLQTEGNHIVGFLGDGVNDSLALDAANVGISVDSGASIAKDLADIILLEKDLNVLVAGVDQGRVTFGNTMKYIRISVLANLGSIISILIATIFFKYEPLTPKQLLVQNFLYNLGQTVIPWDKMEDSYVKTPQRWSLRGLAMFTLWNGPVCSLCDLTTLLFLWLYYKSNSSTSSHFFHSAWFIEGLLMQTLIIHLIRTEKIPFVEEVASWPVTLSTLVISSIGIAIPYTPLGNVMQLMPVPVSYFGFLVVLFLGYFTVGQLVKRAYLLVFKTWF